MHPWSVYRNEQLIDSAKCANSPLFVVKTHFTVHLILSISWIKWLFWQVYNRNSSHIPEDRAALKSYLKLTLKQRNYFHTFLTWLFTLELSQLPISIQWIDILLPCYYCQSLLSGAAAYIKINEWLKQTCYCICALVKYIVCYSFRISGFKVHFRFSCRLPEFFIWTC